MVKFFHISFYILHCNTKLVNHLPINKSCSLKKLIASIYSQDKNSCHFFLFSYSLSHFIKNGKKINLRSKLQLYFGKSSTQNHFIGIPILKPHLSGIAPVSTSNFGRFDPIWTKFGLNLTQSGTAPVCWNYTCTPGF